MNINVETTGGLRMVRIDGEMTIYNAFELKKGLIDCLSCECDILIDLSQVSEIDTSGMQLLLLAEREARRLNRGLRIASHSRATRSVCELYNTAHYFEDKLA